MVKKSRRNVYYDLNESDYTTWYRHMSLTFSSEFNLNRFKDQLHDHINKRLDQYKKLLGLNVDPSFNYVAVLDLYKRIEKRGHRVKYKGVDLSCNLVLESEIKTLKNSKNLTEPRNANSDD